MAFLGRFDAPDEPGCETASPRKRLFWRLAIALAMVLVALAFGSGF